jgi:hypothetical protein
VDKSEFAEKTVSLGSGGLQGRALVRDRLIRHLTALPRPRRVSAAQHEKDLEALAGQLAHMSRAALDGVCEYALRVSGGKACPATSLVRAWALALEPPPPRVSDYAHSILRSVMGAAAMEGGYAVELLRHARRAGPPPGAYLLANLREEAEHNRRRRADIQQAQAMGRASPDQLRWLQAWWDDAALCEALRRDAEERAEGTEGEDA